MRTRVCREDLGHAHHYYPRCGVHAQVKSVASSGIACHYAAIAEDGGLYMWGRNERGQLGTGDLINVYAPSRCVVRGFVRRKRCCRLAPFPVSRTRDGDATLYRDAGGGGTAATAAAHSRPPPPRRSPRQCHWPSCHRLSCDRPCIHDRRRSGRQREYPCSPSGPFSSATTLSIATAPATLNACLHRQPPARTARRSGRAASARAANSASDGPATRLS